MLDTVFLWVCVISGLYMTASCLAVARLRWRARPTLRDNQEGVSILKPLKGVDDDLLGNLRSFCLQDYPVYELLFATKEADDPARQVVEQLQAEFPRLSIRYFLQEPTDSLNPKVANLETMARYAKYDLVLISDSNVRVPVDYVSDMVAMYQEEGAGMVTSMVCGDGEATPSAALENLFLNGIILGGYAFSAAFFGHTFVLGKSILFRLSLFRELGGFSPLHRVIVEDEIMSSWFRKAGHRIVYGTRPICTYNRRWRWGQFLERHIRWARVRLRTATPAYFIEPLAAPLAPALVWLAASGGSVAAWWGVGCAWLSVWLRDQLHARLMERPFFRGYVFFLLPLFAVIHLLLLLLSPWRRVISWRGRSYKIGRRTEILD